MIPYIQAHIWSWHMTSFRKKPHHVLDFYIQDWCWIGNIFNSNPCDLISLHWLLRQYLYLFKTSCWAEVVTSPRRSVTAISELTSPGCHLTLLASDLGQARKKYVYTVHISGLCQSLSSPTLFSKTKEEPGVVALQVVAHEATSELNLAIGVMVHLFGSEVEVLMISWIISFGKWRSFGRKWHNYVVKMSW